MARKIGLGLGGILLLILLVGMGLKLYFNADRLREMVVPQVADSLERPVAIRDIGLGFWGGIHVSVLGLNVGEREGFGTRPFLQVDETHVYVDFWPLLQGRIAIDNVFLSKPNVSVVVAENGVANYADLLEPAEEKSSGEARSVSVQDVVVEDGVVLYNDQKTQTEVQLQGIQYALEMAAQTFNGDLSIGQVGWQQGDVAEALDTGILKLRHRLQMENEAWLVHALDLDWAGLTLTVVGRVETVGDVMQLDLKIAEPGLDLGTTKLREVANLPLDVTGRASLNLVVAGEMNLEATPAQYPHYQGQLSLANVVISGEGVPQETRIDTASVTLVDGLLTLNQLSGRIFDGQVRLSGALDARSNLVHFPVNATLQTDALRLGRALSLTDGVAFDGKLMTDLRVRGFLDKQMKPVLQAGKYSVEGSVSLSDGYLKTPELLTPVDSLALALVFAPKNVVQIKRVLVRAGENDLDVTGRMTNVVRAALEPESNVRPFVVADVQSRVLNMDALFASELPTEGDQTSGMLVAIRQADGRVDMRIDQLVSDSTQFTNFQAVVIAKNGILQVDSIRANTLGGQLTAQAEIDGRTNSAPVKAAASLSRVQANQLLQDYMGWPIPMLGQLGVSVKLDGTMDSTLVLVEKTITADGEARLDEGKVVNWPWLQTSSGFVPHLQFLNFSDLPLKSLVAPFKMVDGRVFLNQMGFKSGDVGFQMAGSVGVDGTLDMAVDADIPASRLNVSGLGLDRIAGLNLKSDTRIPLRIQVGGTSDKPKIEAKLQSEAKKALEAKSEDVKDKAKEKAKGLLKSLF